jgi:thymidylate kinase
MPNKSSIESPAEGVATVARLAGSAQPASAGRVALRDQPPLPLVALARALAQEQVSYCRWTGASGLAGRADEEDVDLLVARCHFHRVAELFLRLGFKPASVPAGQAVPGSLDSFAYDAEGDRLIRLRAHHQLLLGHELTWNYRLPIERQCLSSAGQDGVFRAPAPEYQFIVFVLRSLLRHSTLDILVGRRATLDASEHLADLLARVNREGLRDIVDRDLPFLGAAAFDNCVEALRPTASTWSRLKARLQVLSRLQAHARRPLAVEIFLRLCRRGLSAGRRQVSGRASKFRLNNGGAMIAIVGGDGAGKSTVVDALSGWLSRDFVTASVHLGKPSWSWTTATVRGILKVGQLLGLYPPESTIRETLKQKSLMSTGYPWLLREVCRARDRHLRYVRARRLAADGGLVISDRFPLPQIRIMDGPQAQRFLGHAGEAPQKDSFLGPDPDDPLPRALVKLEESYYQRIAAPEVLIVLRVNPEIAVERRIGEDPTAVRERSTEIWNLDWRHTNAHVIDASKSKAEVLAAVKALVWSEL